MLKINIINWFSYRHNELMIDIIRRYIDGDIRFTDKNPDIVFASVFGDKLKIIDYLKTHDSVSIFFIGESTKNSSYKNYDDYLLDHVDISLGFKYLDHPNYLRFPLWLRYHFPDECLIDKMGYNKVNFNQADFEKTVNFNFLDFKKNFCCILSSHDMNKTRTDIFNRLNLYRKVDSGGNWNRNIDINIDTGKRIKSHNSIFSKVYNPILSRLKYYRVLFEYWLLVKCNIDVTKLSKKFFPSKEQKHKHNWVKNYRFNICCENILDPGYVTEKLFEAFFAGCIPIYLVKNQDDLIEPEVINQDAIIKFTLDNIEEAAEKIIHLDQNQKAYQQFVSQKFFTENAGNHILEKYESFIDRIKSALKEKSSWRSSI